VLLGLELCLARLLLQHMEGLFLGHRHELGGRTRSGLLRRGDLGGLVQRDVTVLQGRAQLLGVTQPLGRRNHGFGATDRGSRHPGELGSVIELARERGHTERSEPLGLSVGREQLPSDGCGQQLGLQFGIGLLQQLDGLIENLRFHASDHDRGV
jgi:hypothetical protein